MTNPFARAYLSEANLPAEELLALYSFHPFHSVRDKLAQHNNVVLLGRQGVGKTMVLRLFEPTLMAQFYSTDSKPVKDERSRLPEEPVVGVYLSLASFDARLKSFRGRDDAKDWWVSAYGDFLNLTLTFRFLESLETLAACPDWCETFLGGPLREDARDRLATDLAAGLSTEVDDFGGIDSVPAFKASLRTRLSRWTRSLNRRDRAAAPGDAAPFGSHLQHAARALRSSGALPDSTRVFCILDQYDSLSRVREVADFRPMFNQAMHEAARSGSQVEYKLGSRPYGMSNRLLLHSAERLEESRELVIADLDEALTPSVYRRFMQDLFRKRLMVAGAVPVRPADASAFAHERLPGLSSEEEAARYVARADTSSGRHLSPFVERWRAMNLPDAAVNEILDNGGLSEALPLHAVLASIALTRWLRDGARRPPLGIDHPPTDSDVLAPAHYAKELAQRIKLRYELGTEKATKEAGLGEVDNFVRDAEQAALFFLASSFKNQQKYYCGFDVLVAVSSQVALVFLEILNAAYEDLTADGHDATTSAVQPEMQSRAVYYVSANHHERVAPEHDYGETLRDLVVGLGSALRRLQLELTVPLPAPNGFSVSTQEISNPATAIPPNRADPQFVLREAETWGILERSIHEDKTPGRPRRYKYYLNRVYCPHANITERTKKDPPYVRDVEGFVTRVIARELPTEFLEVLQRAERLDEAQQALEQINLFGD